MSDPKVSGLTYSRNSRMNKRFVLKNKRMKSISSICLCILLSMASYSQSIEWQPKTRAVVSSSGDSVVHFNILIKTETVKIDNNCVYYWHNKGQICSNQGGYAGELLHGEYLVFNQNKKLITKGNLKEGKKVGVWKSWYENGNLKLIQTFTNGLLDGNSEYYDRQGNLITSHQYKKGDLITEEENKGFSLFKSQNTSDSTSVNNQHEIKASDNKQDREVVQPEKESSDSKKDVEGRKRTTRNRSQ